MTVVLAILLRSAVGFTQEEPKQVQMFEELEAIEDADPERRHLDVLWMPSGLLIESGENDVVVSFDSASVNEVRISVGHKMVVGCEWDLYYFDGTDRVRLMRNAGLSVESLFDHDRMLIRGLEAITEARGSLQIVAELTVFETDIPIQHMWDPKRGHYRVLWRGLATGVLTSGGETSGE
jgi:hypothetical protein